MYLGRIVEIGPTEEIFANPRHPYTKALLKAIPEPDPSRMVPRDLPRGEIPDAAEPPLGCAFHPRCPEAVAELRLGVARPAGAARGALDPREPEVYDASRTWSATSRASTGRPRRSTSAPATPGRRGRWSRRSARSARRAAVEGRRGRIERRRRGRASSSSRGEDPALRRAGGVDVACVLSDGEGIVEVEPAGQGCAAFGLLSRRSGRRPSRRPGCGGSVRSCRWSGAGRAGSACG